MSYKLREYAEKVAESKGWRKEMAEFLIGNIRKEEVIDARAEKMEQWIKEAANNKTKEFSEAEKKEIEEAFEKALKR